MVSIETPLWLIANQTVNMAKPTAPIHTKERLKGPPEAENEKMALFEVVEHER